MRHRKANKNLSRNASHRKAMLRNMVTSLFRFGQLETTDAKAKELRRVAEKMITLSKRGDLHARRQALAFMRDKSVTHKLFEELRENYLHRQGGYVRVVKKGARKGDGAPISVIQILSEQEEKGPGKKKGKAVSFAGAKESKVKTEAKSREEKPEISGKKEEKGKVIEEKAATES
jgi:large subunit ribosomal protein L17